MNPEDIEVEIVPKQVDVWTKVRDNLKEEIDRTEEQLNISKVFLETAEKKLKEEIDNGK